ncbi:MAG: hypothetical protein CMK07_10680 [Ponticaulis sp.]|nr:hypothetical protein [Ponticaulis sp.]
MSDPTQFVIAVAIILSALVSLIGTSARKKAVEEGRAQAADLCELTGIFEPRVLQDIFGPPTLNGIYQVTLQQVKRAQKPLGRLISDDRFDLGCMAMAVLSFFFDHSLVGLGLMIAAGYQLAGWIVSMRLPRQQ